ncbi:MAG TPA: transposase [Gemmatimonadales bacterium]|nr:transposase [Gemmatimonadales bacterium]
MTATTQREESTAAGGDRLLLAIELGRRQWKLGFTTQRGQQIRRRTLLTEAWDRLPEEMAAAKKRLGLSPEAPVTSGYEAGRDGFWIHRYLVGMGGDNLVVDSSSIEVNRRARRAKTDALDLTKLLSMLRRQVSGETKVWRVVHIPSAQDDERRQPHRELWALKRDRTRITNRITGLLATVGIYLTVDAKLLTRLDRLRQWNGNPIPATLRERVVREWEKVVLFTTQIQALERARRLELRQQGDASVALVRRLVPLRGIGHQTAWLFVTELFAWRQFRNRRDVGGLTGLVGTPYRSGRLNHEQGISTAGNKRVRSRAIQVAWSWLIDQQQRALTQWYTERFARGGPVARKIGIVAVARRVVIDLGRYLDAGVIPEGAVFTDHAVATNASGG